MDLEVRRHIKKVMLRDGVPKETIEKVITNHYNKPLSHVNILDHASTSPRIILYAFNWEDSPEGWDFWNAEEEYWRARCE